MIPFLKRNQEASVTTSEKIERKPDNEEDIDYLEGCMEELSAALKAGDAKAASAAFRAAFQICESEPHEEQVNGV